MLWARVDNRLVHGQVIETWLPFTGADTLVVVNSELARDVLQQEIMSLAVPSGIRILFRSVEQLAPLLEAGSELNPADTLFLFKECRDARRAHEAGFAFPVLNIGNLHYGPGKQQLCPHVALSKEDEQCLRYFQDRDVAIDFRCIPSVSVKVAPTW